jgi:TonB family protein
MNERTLTLDFVSIRRSTRRSIFASSVVHAVIFLLLVFSHKAASEAAGLTEITWVDEATQLAALEAAPPVAREETKSAPVEELKSSVAREAEQTENFARPLERAEVAPKPQSSRAVTDILSEKVDAMERNGKNDKTRIASLVQPPRVGVPSLAGVRAQPSSGNSVTGTLNRGDTPSQGAPIALERTAGRPGRAPVVAMAAPPATSKAAPAEAATSTAKRDLAGAQLVGPVADRPLLSYVVPAYPDWAKKDAVEGSVTLYFFVLPDGRVKENILIERTSGFADFDDGGVDALRQWKFKAIPGSSEQWGRITFNYRLSD